MYLPGLPIVNNRLSLANVSRFSRRGKRERRGNYRMKRIMCRKKA
jgi:hypothetical protein